MKKSAFTHSFCIAALSLCALVVSARAQELVQNGGFESSTSNLDFTGWTLSDPNDSFAQNIGTNPIFSHNGVGQHANLAGDPGPDTMTQSLITTPGTTYTFSFWLAHDVTTAPDNTFDVFWNGVSVLPTPLTNVGATAYTGYSFDLLATSASSTIQFSYRDGDDYFRLDDVSVTAAVPEPSTISLGFIGIALVTFAIRHRRRATASA